MIQSVLTKPESPSALDFFARHAVESRAQMQAAIKALEPILLSEARHIPRGVTGTLEHAIESYAPGTFRPVEERRRCSSSMPPR